MEKEEKETRQEESRLVRELSKIDIEDERELADLGLAADFADEPEY